jgi:hypothetical protein
MRKRGGRRAGAGRPSGVREALPRGTVKAVQALRVRVPEGVPDELAEIADEAFNKMVAIVRGSGHRYQGIQLNAARAVREEICGPVATKVEHSGRVALESLTDEQLEAKLRALRERDEDGKP